MNVSQYNKSVDVTSLTSVTAHIKQHCCSGSMQ